MRIDPLLKLREVFREELADHLATLERESVQLGRTDADGRQRALGEAFRAVHSLKGAAGAVDYPAIEVLCHEVESQLADLRGKPVSVEEGGGLAALLDRTRAALDAWQTRLALEAPVASPAPAPAPRPVEPVPAPAAAAAPASATAAALVPADPSAEGSIRISNARVNELMAACEDLITLVGQLHEDKKDRESVEGSILHIERQLRRLRAELPRRAPELVASVDAATVALESVMRLRDVRARRDAGHRTAAHEGIKRVLDQARGLGVVKVSTLAPLLERTVQSTARGVGKQATFVLVGGSVEVDRRVVERLRDPLVHLLRNAVDHGIELPADRARAGKPPAGVVTVAFHARGTEVEIVVTDDGGGIDEEGVQRAAARQNLGARPALELVLEPGFSFRDQASHVSGRGMGLDVVRGVFEELGGRLDLSSQPMRGTRVAMRTPLDLSLARCLIAELRDLCLAIPTSGVVRVRRISRADERQVEGKTYIEHDGRLVPLASLAELLGLRSRDESRSESCVILSSADRVAALRVDAVDDEREVVIKPLGARVRAVPYVAGGTILRSGGVALVLDVASLVLGARPAARVAAAEPVQAARLLVVDDSITTRQLMRSLLEGAGYHVVVAADGEEAWDIVRGGELDLVVSDVEMPRLDGFQLLSRIRRAPVTAKLPVVLVTALAQDEDRRRAMELGATAYVVKGGFDQQELLSLIEEIL